MSRIFRSSLLIGAAFGVNKLVALLRQYLIVSHFGIGGSIDAFNAANNIPDLIFSLFSGGALTMAFIPVFAEYMGTKGREKSWKLFSNVASVMFILTALLSVIVGVLAPVLVGSPFGIAPGFPPYQQLLVVRLLRIDLAATLVFSVSGLVLATLQAHNQFLLPAIAPVFYNVGIIFGMTVLTPFMGIYGLAYGVVIGAVLHLAVQVPGLITNKFRFTWAVDLADTGLRKVLRLMGPRLLTVLLVQITFLMRDNLASHLETGSVTILTYGYFIMQVPETLIGTSIATALFPTLSSHVSGRLMDDFSRLLSQSTRVLIAVSVISVIATGAVLKPAIDAFFPFTSGQSALLAATTNAFMAGLLAQNLLEVGVRAFYARQQAVWPFVATGVRSLTFGIFAVLFSRQSGVVGIASADSLSVSIEAAILFILLIPFFRRKRPVLETVGRSLVGAVAALSVVYAVPVLVYGTALLKTTLGVAAGTLVYLLFIREELQILRRL